MDLRDTIVTEGAMNCQKETTAAMVSRKEDYVFALEGKQQLFYEEVKDYFDEDILERLKVKEGYCKKMDLNGCRGGTGEWSRGSTDILISCLVMTRIQV